MFVKSRFYYYLPLHKASSKRRTSSNKSEIDFHEGFKLHGSARNWMLSATNFKDYLNIMFAVKNEIRKTTNTIHVTDTKLDSEPCWEYQLDKCRNTRQNHTDPFNQWCVLTIFGSFTYNIFIFQIISSFQKLLFPLN